MWRQSFLRLCKGATATATGSNGGGRCVTEELEGRTNNIFSIRRAPNSLYEDKMHSNSLTDHPLTHRTSRDELAYRKRKLTERGNYEQAAKAEEEAERRDTEGRAGAETREYYSAICFVVLGYLTAHGVVFKRFYPDDLRPYYSPDRGYSDDVAARRQDLEAVDELIGMNVMESLYSKRKEVFKSQMA
ncbi:putative transmembrane protein [Trypanosoma cruzi]|uniref:Transmembrane protein n=2 Tax=Trypanosoma cruzi TaxID=5693 RepID=Q4DWQ8_TRYCC|nr:hypothetical protein, conserved [Trypanosoma cruzi]EAN96946.1 hypothetical protein, conserved [Trypanosoma cruzi]PWV02132.1 putative transmembrane protein [Trypanosoma cruzi]|eukprot:XP_818797.1 hypothetical protein [Trypanosoma cruzi strain CL Brener]